MFLFDPGNHHEEFSSKGYVHLKNILSEDFRAFLDEFYMRSLLNHEKEKDDWKIRGKKRQYLFDFPSGQLAQEFRSAMASLTGIDPEDFTISERHLKVYDGEAAPWPAPHKDRAASEISIGLPVHIPAGSTACLFPQLQFGPNVEEKAIFLTDSDYPDLSHIYQMEEAVMLNEQVGDIIAFLGSSIFHERVRAADTAILYIKVNGSRRDPLGENIFAAEFV